MKLWAVLNNQTQSLAWTTTGHPAVFRTRELARESLRSGQTCLNGKVVKLETQAVEAEETFEVVNDDLWWSNHTHKF